jgi:hypothetical protein
LARTRKPALALMAGIVLAVIAACSGSSASTNPTTGVAGTPGAGATGPAASTAVNPNDPNSILTNAISGGANVKSFHIKIAISGTVNASALSDAAGSGGAVPLTGDLKLDGTAIEGDVDIANAAAHLTANVPALPAFGNVPISADLVLKTNVLYYKTTLTGPKYSQLPLSNLSDSLSGLSSGLPVPTPGADASGMAGVTDEINQLRQQMQAAGVTASLVGVDQIGGKDANHINISIPIDKLNAEIAAQASDAAGAAKIDSASFDVWIYKDNAQLAKLELKVASSAFGNIDFTITVTNYDQPVTVNAPAAADINP